MNYLDSLLIVRNVSACYDGIIHKDKNVLEDITFTLKNSSGLIALIGPNGSGKTTLLRAITGELPVRSGQILLSGVDITDQPTHRRHGLGCIFQKALDGMCSSLTIQENLSIMFIRNNPSLLKPLLSKKRNSGILEKAKIIASSQKSQLGLMLNLQNVFKRYPNEFSGGEIQQLCLLALLLQEPKARLVLADEPTLNLDKENRQICMNLLVELSKLTTVLVATHDNDIVKLCARTLELNQGRLNG